MAKGDNPFMEEEFEIAETTDIEKKAKMFEQDNDDLKVEPKSALISAFYVEPSLKQRLVNFAEGSGVKQSVVLRAAIQEFLEKRGL